MTPVGTGTGAAGRVAFPHPAVCRVRARRARGLRAIGSTADPFTAGQPLTWVTLIVTLRPGCRFGNLPLVAIATPDPYPSGGSIR
jgi:hypothetical protein